MENSEKIETVKGTKKEFLDFIKNIDNNDKIAILSHTDLDGVSSAVFIKEILKTLDRDKQIRITRFLENSKTVLKEIHQELKKSGITKIFMSDLAADNHDGFKELKKDFGVFLIDHHPLNTKLNKKEKENILKTPSGDCSGITLFRLGSQEGLIGKEKWSWLAQAAVVADMSYKKERNLKFLKKNSPKLTPGNIYKTKIGKITNIISFSLVYYKSLGKDLKEPFYYIINKRLSPLKRKAKKVEKSIKKNIKNFRKNAEYFPDKKTYFYHIKSKYNIAGEIATMLSTKETKKIFIIDTDNGTHKGEKITKISTRSQKSSPHMGELMKKATGSLKYASGGGHQPAAAARVRKKDLEKFKKRVLENL